MGELDAPQGLQVEVEALEADAEEVRQRRELDALKRVALAAAALTVVLVVAVERLRLKVCAERLLRSMAGVGWGDKRRGRPRGPPMASEGGTSSTDE